MLTVLKLGGTGREDQREAACSGSIAEPIRMFIEVWFIKDKKTKNTQMSNSWSWLSKLEYPVDGILCSH